MKDGDSFLENTERYFAGKHCPCVVIPVERQVILISTNSYLASISVPFLSFSFILGRT